MLHYLMPNLSAKRYRFHGISSGAAAVLLYLKNILLFLFLTTCQPYFCQAQLPIQTVKGKIIDKETKIPLPGASIKLVDDAAPLIVSTDTLGNYAFDVSVGRHSFHVSFTGYEELMVPDILITSGKEVVLNIELRESITKLKEVVIGGSKSVNNPAAVSANVLRPQDASHFAGGLYDPSKMVSSFAGVSAADVDLNEIIIRGNSPKGLLWRLEGIEIPNPNHFPDGQGGSGGSLSMVSSDMLSTFDFLTGAFPAEYGNATSGVMDLNLRKGNPDTHECTILVGDVGLQGTLEGPLAKGYNGSYLINYRYATLALVDQLHLANLGDNNVPSKFQDVSYVINLPTINYGTFELFGVEGTNSTGSQAVIDSSKWTTWDQHRDEHENHSLLILGLKYQYLFPNHRTYFKATVVSTSQYDLWDKGYLIQNYFRQTEHRERYINQNYRVNLVLNHSFNARASIRAGMVYSHFMANMFEENYLWHKGSFETNVDTIGRTGLLQSYVQAKYRFTDRLEAFAGTHIISFQLNHQCSIEPRFSLKYKLSGHHLFTFGSGIHSRIEALPLYYANVLLANGNSVPAGNRSLGLTKAFHTVLGYEYVPDNIITFKVEAYTQLMFNVPASDDPTGNFSTLNLTYGLADYQLKNIGHGRNFGLEFTLEKSYQDNYYYLATLSLFNSQYQLSSGQWYATSFDGHYIANGLIGKDFKIGHRKINTFGLNLKTVYKGGQRTTPIDLSKSILADRAIYIVDQTDKECLPDVFELDFGINYRNNGNGFSWIVSLDIQNLLNNDNILSYTYSGGDGKINTVRGKGIVPVANFRIEF